MQNISTMEPHKRVRLHLQVQNSRLQPYKRVCKIAYILSIVTTTTNKKWHSRLTPSGARTHKHRDIRYAAGRIEIQTLRLYSDVARIIFTRWVCVVLGVHPDAGGAGRLQAPAMFPQGEPMSSVPQFFSVACSNLPVAWSAWSKFHIRDHRNWKSHT